MFSWWGNNEKKENPKTDAEETGVNNSNTESVTNDTAAETATDLAKNFGSFLYSVANAATRTAVKVKDSVKETVEGQDILSNFNKEQEKFLSEKQNKRKETGVPPWVGYHEEETMKTQILALSSDERNFLRDPPSGVQFHYDYDSIFPVALATLEEDPQLKTMRFNLVPKKVNEKIFWRNYFYRVSLIKQSSQLTSLATSSAESLSTSTENLKQSNQSNQLGTASNTKSPKNEDKENEKISEDLGEMTLSSSPPQEEFISDAFEGAQELSKEDLKQIGVDRINDKNIKTKSSASTLDSKDESKSGETVIVDVPDWERELQEELQEYDVLDDDNDDGSWEKEIEDMLEAVES